MNSLVLLESLWMDAGYAARQLRRSPGFTMVAVLSLALGIGVNTAIFSLLDQVLLRTLPVKDPHELVFLYHPGPLAGSVSTDEGGGPSFSYPVFRGLQKHQGPFAGLAGARMTSASLSYRGQASPGAAHRVSGNYFDVLGVRAALGRVFSDDDDRTPGAHPVVVLSHRYWTSRWGSDVSMLNRTLSVNGHPMTIVGVAQKGFESERRGGSVDVFVPISMNQEITPDWNGFEDRKDHWVTLVARLRPGLTRTQAEAAIGAAYREQLEEDFQGLGPRSRDFLERYRAKRIVLAAGEGGRGGPGRQARLPLLVLMGMTLLVLLIACANVANLQLARAARRSGEISVRLALGGSRFRLVRALMVEAGVLALAGAALGLLEAHWALGALLARLPPGPAGLFSHRLDERVLLFCLALSLVSSLLFGLYPALQSSRLDLVTSLKDKTAGAGGGRPGRTLGRSLVTCQIAVSLLLLVGAGLFAKTFLNLTRMELGLRADGLLTFSLRPRINRYSEARTALLYQELTERLQALPGVKLVTAARVPAIAGSNSGTNITVEGFVPRDEEASQCSFNEVGLDYFRTMGIPLVAGRELAAADGEGAPRVALVNEAFGRQFLPGTDPLGRRFARGAGGPLDIEIVGVVKDAKYSSMREAPPPVFYTSYRQGPPPGELYFYVRTATDPEATEPAIRREVASLAPDLPLRELKTMRRQIEDNVFAERLLSALTGIFGGLATLLASVGLYGVLAYDVARRTREIGIRMALGAQAAQVRGLVLREVSAMLAIGMAGGVAAAAGLGRLVGSLLYGMRPWDPAVYTSAIGVLAVVVMAAAYLPARRATRVDPMLALRHE